MEFTHGNIGHERVRAYLKRALVRGVRNHAYIFVGAHHLGKSMLAAQAQQAFLCAQPISAIEACGACHSCSAFKNGTHPDHLKISPSEDGVISIDTVREAKSRLSLHTFSGTGKTVMVEGAERLTSSAANALLKTLEEPHGNVLYILTTPNEKDIPDTVYSRCTPIHFYPVDQKSIEAALLERGIDKKRARIISALSHGRPGVALQLSLVEDSEQPYREHVSMLATLSKENVQERLRSFELLSGTSGKKNDDSGQLLDIISQWQILVHDALLIQQGITEPYPREYIDFTKPLHVSFSPSTLSKIMGACFRVKYLLERHMSPRLAFDYFTIAV